MSKMKKIWSYCGVMLILFFLVGLDSSGTAPEIGAGQKISHTFRFDWCKCTGINHFVIKDEERVAIGVDKTLSNQMAWDAFRALNIGLKLYNTGKDNRVSKIWIVGRLTDRKYIDPATQEEAHVFILYHWFIERPFTGAIWVETAELPSGGYYTQSHEHTKLTIGDFEPWLMKKYSDFNPAHYIQKLL